MVALMEQKPTCLSLIFSRGGELTLLAALFGSWSRGGWIPVIQTLAQR